MPYFLEAILALFTVQTQVWGITAADWCIDSKCEHHQIMASSGARRIIKQVLSVEQAEGVGARVRRSVGRPEVQ